MMLTRNDALACLDKALSFVSADTATASLHGHEKAATRFSDNAISQNLVQEDLGLQVAVAFGDRRGVAKGNALSEEAMRETVRRAEALARISPRIPRPCRRSRRPRRLAIAR